MGAANKLTGEYFMKTQMKFQKIICLVMIIVGALALLYAFAYLTGSVAELSYSINKGTRKSTFVAADGKYDALFYMEIQGFNDILMYCGIAMILLAVLLYITSCQKRRNYYVTNYIATGLCAGGNIVMAIVLMIYNTFWKGEFLKVDFAAWYKQYEMYDALLAAGGMNQEQYNDAVHYGESTLWFDLGYAVFAIVIVASLLLIFNLVWKIMLMQGEKKLLANNQLAGGVV